MADEIQESLVTATLMLANFGTAADHFNRTVHRRVVSPRPVRAQAAATKVVVN